MNQRCKIGWLSVAALSVILFSGCDHNKPSPGNFKAALQTHFDQTPQCLNLRVDKFPADAVFDDKGKPAVRYGIGINSADLAETFAALKDAGMLTAQDGVKTVPGSGWGDRAKSRRVITYAIAPESKSLWQIKGNTEMLCYGYVHVKSVDNYTEPADMLGQTSSTVSFTYNVDRIAPWAQNAEVQKAVPNLTAIVSADRQDKALLVLTHNGWMLATQ
ncbi:MAG: hypothetical protein WCA21_15500 [Terracidiphilus sp.]